MSISTNEKQQEQIQIYSNEIEANTRKTFLAYLPTVIERTDKILNSLMRKQSLNQQRKLRTY